MTAAGSWHGGWMHCLPLLLSVALAAASLDTLRLRSRHLEESSSANGTDDNEDDEDYDDSSKTGGSDDDGGATATLLQVQVTEQSLPFWIRDSVDALELLSSGEVNTPFDCDGEELADLAMESQYNDVRRLTMWQTLPDSPGGFLDSLKNAFSEEKTPAGSLIVSNVSLALSTLKDDVIDKEAEAVVRVALSGPPGLEIQDEEREVMTLIYDCLRPGKAIVEMRFALTHAEGSEAEQTCMRWVKECGEPFAGLTILEGGDSAVKEGVLVPTWQKTAMDTGTHDSVTKIEVASKGITRLRPPIVTSSQKLLTVEGRGTFFFGEEAYEVQDTTSLSIQYTCDFDGHADVTLTFEKATLDSDAEADTLSLTWRKHCGARSYTDLSVIVRSEAFQNKTAVVESGETLAGFRRICQTSKRKSRSFMEDHEGCQGSSTVGLTLPAHEARTVLDFRVAPEGVDDPPVFQPEPDITYDSRLMDVRMIQMPRSMHGVVKQSSSEYLRSKSSSMTLKYTCLQEGVSVVLVTLHVLAHKPIEFAWKKECVKPKIKKGKALTAPQALAIAFGICGIIGFIVCAACWLCSSDSQDFRDLYGENPTKFGSARRPDRETELAGLVQPNRVGVDTLRDAAAPGPEGEVTYH
eukprot:TRINITY_DN31021_c0_g1_i1.p1 TRINITY_DN31021_c0_g1~~TRINITY_DN31021_c0_g1_i1.p1  ORF type:complete len:635 (-),score=109.29 TRINITY_DN31021_c0_g1_i1:394-2298(-)